MLIASSVLSYHPWQYRTSCQQVPGFPAWHRLQIPAVVPLDLSYDRVSSNQTTLYFQSPLPAMYQSEYPVASSFAWLSILLKSACYIEWHTVCNKPSQMSACGFHACPDEVFLQALERQILFLHNRKQFAFENLKIKQNDSAGTKYAWPWKWIGCINCLKTN